MENGIFRSEIGSGFEDPGGTPPPRIPRSTSSPPGPDASRTSHDVSMGAVKCTVAIIDKTYSLVLWLFVLAWD